MTLDKLASMVKWMRERQREAHATPNHKTLRAAADAERRVDEALKALEKGPDLFGEGTR